MKDDRTLLESGSVGRGTHTGRQANTVFRPTGTSTWLMEYSVSGTGLARVDGKDTQLTAGSFIMYQAGAPQDYDVDPRVGEWDHIWFCFDPRPHWQEWLHWPELGRGVYFVQAPDAEERRLVVAEMERALKLANSVLVRRRDLAMNILEEVLLYCDMWNPVGRTARLDDRVQVVMEYINEHIAEKLTVTGLAAVCALSPSRLAHLFREEMGVSTMQYIESRRIELARELLVMTRQPVAQIADTCGFRSPFYFSRVLKSRTGLSPRQIRRQGL